MKIRLLAIGVSAFLLGGVCSFFLFARTAGNKDVVVPLERRNTASSVATKSDSWERRYPERSSRNLPAEYTADDYLSRDSMKRFLSISSLELGNREVLMQLGLNEIEAAAVVEAYAVTTATVRTSEAARASFQVDEDGEDFLLIPKDREDSTRILSVLEGRLKRVLSQDSANIFTEIIGAAVYGRGPYRTDEYQRAIYEKKDEDGNLVYDEQLFIGEDGPIYSTSSTSGKETPAWLSHLFPN
jgi:hypothetical protein